MSIKKFCLQYGFHINVLAPAPSTRTPVASTRQRTPTLTLRTASTPTKRSVEQPGTTCWSRTRATRTPSRTLGTRWVPSLSFVMVELAYSEQVCGHFKLRLGYASFPFRSDTEVSPRCRSFALRGDAAYRAVDSYGTAVLYCKRYAP